MEIKELIEQKKKIDKEISELKGLFGDVSVSSNEKFSYSDFESENVFVKTVTHHYTGHVVEVTRDTIKLENACWIADDGRFNESMKDSNNFNEVEPFKYPIELNKGAILVVTKMDTIPREVK
jgi:hypothetical protein